MGSPANESGRQSDEVQHQVTITRDFWLKESEVTQGEWRSLMGSNPSAFSTCGDGCPVELVSWFDAVDYVNALSRSEGLPECYGTNRTFVGLSCRGFRLPTEAEWEYAARAGTTGERYGPLDAIAWHSGNSGGRTQPVRGKQANAWGLYDMIGNVWEWTHDWYDAYGGAATDPLGPGTGSRRVLRGGGWGFDAALCRAAVRDNGGPGYRRGLLGFRPARSVFP
jgi:formylglycine-generating enzyme required for sulfatase activity